jgi:hypothetical protein
MYFMFKPPSPNLAKSSLFALLLTLGLLLTACAGLPIGGSTTPTAVSASKTVSSIPTSVATYIPTSIATYIPTTIVSAPTNPLSSTNLIVNGNAEAGPGTTDETVVEPVPGWTRHGSVDVIQYAATSGNYVAVTDPGPTDRGKNFFYGGADGLDNFGDNTTTSLTQTIDISVASVLIATGNVQYTLSGWLGGYSSQDDNAKLTVQFVGATGQALGTASVGPVLAADRNNNDGLILRTTTGKIPVGTTKINVTVLFTKLAGGDNDGSADDLSLLLHA